MVQTSILVDGLTRLHLKALEPRNYRVPSATFLMYLPVCLLTANCVKHLGFLSWQGELYSIYLLLIWVHISTGACKGVRKHLWKSALFPPCGLFFRASGKASSFTHWAFSPAHSVYCFCKPQRYHELLISNEPVAKAFSACVTVSVVQNPYLPARHS